jgi:hypothetical protein
MNFWIWFAIWAVLVLASLGWLGYVANELLIKTKANLHQVEKLQINTAPLLAAIDEKVTLERPIPSLLEPIEAVKNRDRLKRDRKHKSEDRQRRLIARLHDIKVDESRFR